CVWGLTSSHAFRPARKSLVHKSVHALDVTVGHTVGYRGFLGQPAWGLGVARMGHARPWLAVPGVSGRGSRIGQRGGRARMTDIDRAADIEVSRGFAQVTVRIPLTGLVSQEWLSVYNSLAHKRIAHSGNENAFPRRGEGVMEAQGEPDRSWIIIGLPAGLDRA